MFTITISGKDGEKAVKWSKEVDTTEALRLMARLEGFHVGKRKPRQPVVLLAPRKSNGKPHELQAALLKIAGEEDISDCSLREIGRRLGGVHPQKIVHHLNQLVTKGLLSSDRKPLSTS